MTFLVPYAYDRMPGGKPREGVPGNRLGSQARCDALINKAWSTLKHDDHVLMLDFCFLMTAGFSKENRSEPNENLPKSLADQMATYIRATSPSFSVKTDPSAWGTYEETRESIRMIFPWTGINEGPDVYVSTNLGHMPRVRLCWFFLKPHGWKVHFVRADHSFSRKEWRQETAKFFIYLYRFLFKKW